MSYCQHQRNATRLICTVCQKPYDVTHADKIEVFVCMWCAKKAPVTDINGVVMTDP